MNKNKYLDFPIVITKHNWHDDIIPVVSIFNWTFNHKDYIRQSIESILSQKTTFRVEIIIHDDASNDGTKEIILEYQNKYPQLFRNILHDKNQYSQGKCIMTPLFEKPRGEYIALAHGDDYWIDCNKLQDQVFKLNNDSSFGMVCTNCYFFNQSKNKRSFFSFSKKSNSYNDLLKRNSIITSTSLIRISLLKSYLIDINPLQQGWLMQDYPMWLYISLNSKIYYSRRITTIYRVLNGSFSHSKNIFENEKFIKSFYDIRLFYSKKYSNINSRNHHDALNANLASNSIKFKNFDRALMYFNKIKHKRLIDYLRFIKILNIFK
jgi:glycosyltransferase involved in cell wall biosynthesis